ncbi:hypothetical protein JL100_030695 (plasmid) [Skermanella mucosa]|uniref:hypothetical protein n=1 Tax=Skermanella mucosa TaxID=1789672 RepID=UPI00192B2D6A|nr:hypothetical protein [Skermanella mucosa]UEM24584.1 hypothetical protein JL100_030695 [Skermanella mucosa]
MAKKIGKLLLTKLSALAKTDQSGVTTVLGGEATAVGQDTLAEGKATLQVKDLGAVTVVKGTASFGATAQSTGGSTAYATADSFADVSGADIVITRTKSTSNTTENGDSTTWTETSTTRVLAIDIEGITLPKTLDLSAGLSKVLSKIQGFKAIKKPDPVDLDGNVAKVQIDVLVEGENTYADVGTSVLTVEDTLSTVNASITTGIA